MSQELKSVPVDRNEFMALRARSPLRMSLARFLKRDEKQGQWVGKCTAPFMETVGPLFARGAKCRLSPNQYGAFRCVQSEGEFNRIRDWVKKQGSRVLIRSLLPCCVALDFLRNDPESPRTQVGELEYLAKRGDLRAEAQLGELLARHVRDMPFYSDARFIAAVPPLREKSFGLAANLARIAASELGIFDLTDNFHRYGDAPPIKNMAEQDKWDGVEKAKLVLRSEPKSLPQKGESVILLDDKYQSGTTMHYVAMRMQAAGVNGPILGLAAVKTLSNDDNK